MGVSYLPNERKYPIACLDEGSTIQYSLTPNFFDPNHHSPPNDFLLKLQIRLNEYYKKESNLFSE
jgi:hypothetical protein